jgi:hypothetical protein
MRSMTLFTGRLRRNKFAARAKAVGHGLSLRRDCRARLPEVSRSVAKSPLRSGGGG